LALRVASSFQFEKGIERDEANFENPVGAAPHFADPLL
jgi:hypothetical protein